MIHAAGVSPSQAAPATILAVDLYGTALIMILALVLVMVFPQIALWLPRSLGY